MENVVLAENFIAAINTADTEAMRRIYAEDAKIWHDFDRVEQDPETNVQSLLVLRKAIPNIQWVTKRIEPLPQGFLLIYELTMTLGEKKLQIPACVIATVENERIIRLEEWVNSAPMMKYLTPEQLAILSAQA